MAATILRRACASFRAIPSLTCLHRIPRLPHILPIPPGALSNNRTFSITLPRKQSNPTEALLAEITRNMKQIPLGCLLYQKSHFTLVLDSMLSSGFSRTEICDLFVSRPMLLTSSGSDLQNRMDVLLSNAFTPSEICHILKSIPDVRAEDAGPVMAMLTTLGFMDRERCKMINTCPQILLQTPAHLSGKYSGLMSIFRRSDITHMLRKYPAVFLQTTEEVSKKILYVHERMGLDQTEMVWADVLGHDLTHIRTRHLFLERVGKFEKPDSKGSTRIVNPYLKDMLGTSDKEFAVKIAGLTLDEYTVFKKIVLLERELLQQEFDDRFDSDDEDNPEAEKVTGYKAERVKKERMKKQLIDFT